MKAMFVTVSTFIICSINLSGGQWDWCSEAAKCLIDGKKVENTMCSMKALPENEVYKDIKETTTDDDRATMLAWHNTYRDKIASGAIKDWPKAANMRQMTWDKDLEEVALRFSFQTRRGHDVCRRTEKYEEVGQNCAMAWNYPVGIPLPNISTFFEGWVDEILLVTEDMVVDKMQFDPSWGHFTAVVWADTYKVGCGMTRFLPKETTSSPNDPKYFQGRHGACNLYPMGNFLDMPTYKRGEPCTACPQGTACNPNSTHPHLCALPGDPADEPVTFIGKLPGRAGMQIMVDYYAPSILLLITRLF